MTHKIPESVLVVIYTADLQVLLLERADKPGFWQSVTGSKDDLHEAIRLTAQRELEEETGFRVALDEAQAQADTSVLPAQCLQDWQLTNVYEIYLGWRHRYAPGVSKNTEHVFGLLMPEASVPRLSPREHLQYRWLPYREAADMCFSPSNAEAILQLS